MSIEYKSHSVETSEEQSLLIRSITDSKFCKSVIEMVVPELLYLPISRKVFAWIQTYFETHHEAPGRHIEDIFSLEKSKLDFDEAEAIELLLSQLSIFYEEDNETANTEFLIDKAEIYLRKRALEVHVEKCKSLISVGQLEEAESEVANFNRVSKVTAESVAINPHDPEFIKKVFDDKDGKDILFKFPGVLGEMFGPFRRGWEIVCQAAYKVGKTHQLQAIRMCALNHRLNVLDVNHEMSEKELALRHYRGLLRLPEVKGDIMFPVFDCHLNQTGTCNKPYRMGEIRLYGPDEDKPAWARTPKGYKWCDHCRHHKELRHQYVQTTWMSSIAKEAITKDVALKRIATYEKFTKNRLRFKSFPRGTANISRDIKRTLDILADQGWIADVVNDDYAEIHAAENPKRSSNDEQKLNDALLAGASLAEEYHLLYSTAAQVKTNALKKKHSSIGDASQSARAIYAHPVIVYALSQTPKEKYVGLKRINIIAHRFSDFNETKEIYVLQQLQAGQAILDSEWVDKEEQNDKDKERKTIK